MSSSVDVWPLDELSTSETPESAGLGGKEPETDRRKHQESNDVKFIWNEQKTKVSEKMHSKLFFLMKMLCPFRGSYFHLLP